MPLGLAANYAPRLVSATASGVVVAAPAKLNLHLEVLRRRADGFHELETLVAFVGLFDTLEFARTPGRGFSLACSDPRLPAGPGNLVCRAAAALERATGAKCEASCRLTKRVPSEAGLGGGSSDAAATLVGLNHLLNLNCGVVQLRELAAGLGSDVPAFLCGPAAWCTGRGEAVEAAAVGGPLHWVLAKPAEGLSTARVYGALALGGGVAGGDGAKQALAAGTSAELGARLFNRLEAPAAAQSPGVRRLLELFRSARRASPETVLGVVLCGSGSTVAALVAGQAEGRRLAESVTPPDSAWVVGSV